MFFTFFKLYKWYQIAQRNHTYKVVQNWRTGKGNSKKIIMPKKHERHKTADPVDTRRRFNVYKTSIRRRRSRIDVL